MPAGQAAGQYLMKNNGMMTTGSLALLHLTKDTMVLILLTLGYFRMVHILDVTSCLNTLLWGRKICHEQEGLSALLQ